MADQAVNLWQYYRKDYPLNVMVVGHTDCEAGYTVERNQSRIMAIEYICSGSGTLEINGKFYEPVGGTAILLTKGSKHKYATSNDNLWKKRWVVFDGPFMEQLLALYLPRGVYCFPACELGPYFDEIDRIVFLYQNDYSKLLDKITVVLLQMVLCIKNQSGIIRYDLAEQIRQELDGRLSQKLSLTELAARFSYSKNHIIRIFKEKYGVTPYQYFIERKVDVAKLYLCNTNYSITEIASLLSFTDEHYFSNYFHSAVGLPPSVYRRKMQQDNGHENPTFVQ